jgi:hypothetical protein
MKFKCVFLWMVCMFLLYMYKPLKKGQEWIFIVSFEQDMRKNIYVKVWFVKQSSIIVIYQKFYTFYHKTKW